jgi:hypothetical protein
MAMLPGRLPEWKIREPSEDVHARLPPSIRAANKPID